MKNEKENINMNIRKISEVMEESFNDTVIAFREFAIAITEINRITEQRENAEKSLVKALHQNYRGDGLQVIW